MKETTQITVASHSLAARLQPQEKPPLSQGVDSVQVERLHLQHLGELDPLDCKNPWDHFVLWMLVADKRSFMRCKERTRTWRFGRILLFKEMMFRFHVYRFTFTILKVASLSTLNLSSIMFQ